MEYGCQIFPEEGKISPQFAEKIKQINFLKRNSRSSIEVSGSIAENTLWDVDTVKVVGNVQIEDGVTLSITAGAKIEFSDYFAINVHGTILAVGESNNFIYFTSERPEFFELDHSTAGAWNGIRFDNTNPANETSILEFCLFEYSKNVEENGIGGAISCFDFSKLKIENCVFRNNLADYGGAIGFEFNSNAILAGNIFTENYAFLGGSPIYCTYSYPKLINNTIVGNTVLNEDIFFGTGAVHSFQSKPQIYNNIIWNNAGYFFEESPLFFCKSFYVEYNDIEFGFAGEGNIDLDPDFVDQPDQNFSLQANSPCINAGSNELFWNNELTEFDLLGNPRINNNIVDMGAYEYYSTGITSDQLPVLNAQFSNYPNPFNPSTTIVFSLTAKDVKNAKIEIYNLKGQKVEQFTPSLCHPEFIEGRGEIRYRVIWNGIDQTNHPVASGIYFAKVKAGNQILTRKMLLMK